jgi:hypothetical protein
VRSVAGFGGLKGLDLLQDRQQPAHGLSVAEDYCHMRCFSRTRYCSPQGCVQLKSIWAAARASMTPAVARQDAPCLHTADRPSGLTSCHNDCGSTSVVWVTGVEFLLHVVAVSCGYRAAYSAACKRCWFSRTGMPKDSGPWWPPWWLHAIGIPYKASVQLSPTVAQVDIYKTSHIKCTSCQRVYVWHLWW